MSPGKVALLQPPVVLLLFPSGRTVDLSGPAPAVEPQSRIGARSHSARADRHAPPSRPATFVDPQSQFGARSHSARADRHAPPSRPSTFADPQSLNRAHPHSPRPC